MSYGARANAVSEAERAAEAASAVTRPADVVMVKLRTTRPREGATAAARGVAVASAAGVSLLSSLLSSGAVAEATPVFPAAKEPARGVARTTMGAALGVDAVPAADTPVRRARGLTTLRVTGGQSAVQLARDLMADPAVEYAYVPAVKHPAAAAKRPASKSRRKKPSQGRVDPLFARQWSHAAVRIHEARKRAGFRDAADVLVAIVDSGVDRGHPDLKKSIDRYTNFLTPDEDDRDYQGHGTHVAGIVAAGINNGVGIAGLCKARLAIFKALPRRGGTWNAAAYYRALAKASEVSARVLNLSLGGSFDPGEQDVILDLIDDGVVVVAAMGNEYEDGNPTSYPAAYDGVVAVGATDEVDRRAAFSCVGPHISLVAPGERILSTVPRYPSELAETTLYDSWPGTSMAAPHVAAAAALLLAKNPKSTPAQVRTKLQRSADRLKWQSSRPDDEYGWGRLNLARALR